MEFLYGAYFVPVINNEQLVTPQLRYGWNFVKCFKSFLLLHSVLYIDILSGIVLEILHFV